MNGLLLALLGGILVIVVVVVAIVLLGLRALDRARPEDVPTVTGEIMRTLRDGRRAIQNRASWHPHIETERATEREQR